MISKKYIKSLDFQDLNDIFYYIMESSLNGNHAQYKELVNKLSKAQFKLYLEWLQLDYRKIQQAINTRCKA